jgi:hypothetical protein
MMHFRLPTRPRFCGVDKHVLVVVYKRRWWPGSGNLSYLKCLSCDLKLGPLPTEISRPQLGRPSTP